ncbi:MAG: ATP-binding protein [Thermoleophilaceae bacterium]|nr:ATP-binding protein [Thermoleophilaceae bacterium]
MASPFVYEEPVDPSGLIDRAGELRLLEDRALDGRNSRLEGARRYGKTSLLRATLAAVQRDGAIPIEVGFLGCVTAADVAQRIERAYSAQLDSRLRRWYDGLVRTLNPTVSAAPAGVGVKATPQISAPGLLDRLALPRRIHERTGRPCVIAFDEFQEVVRIDAALPGVFRSELEGQGNAAAYIFSGSHPGLMRALFGDRRHAFFAQAAPVEVGRLPPDDLADYIVARFADGRRDPGEALGPLLDAAEGHPQRAMLLAHHLYERLDAGQRGDIEAWIDALQAARLEGRGEVQVLWESCTSLERRVLKVIAQRTVALGSHEADVRFGLPKGGSARAAVERLLGDGHLVDDAATRTGWRLVDPFLGSWLRES